MNRTSAPSATFAGKKGDFQPFTSQNSANKEQDDALYASRGCHLTSLDEMIRVNPYSPVGVARARIDSAPSRERRLAKVSDYCDTRALDMGRILGGRTPVHQSQAGKRPESHALLHIPS